MLVALLLSSCAATGPDAAEPGPGGTLAITQQVWSQYRDYVAQGRGLGPDRSGAFAVGVWDGVGIAGLGAWNYCPRMYDGCRPGGPTAVTRVMEVCRREGVACIIFARNESIQVAYQIVDRP
jgi:hypothetical protein